MRYLLMFVPGLVLFLGYVIYEYGDDLFDLPEFNTMMNMDEDQGEYLISKAMEKEHGNES
jgi:hypothetical protein